MLLSNQESEGRSEELSIEPDRMRRERNANLRKNTRPVQMTIRVVEEGKQDLAITPVDETVQTASTEAKEQDAATLWERVRRSKLVEWCVAYAAGAFVLLEVMDVFSDVWGWPLVFQKAVTLVLALGLIVTATLAWFRSEGTGARGWCVDCGIDLLIVAAMIGGLVLAVQLTVGFTG